LLPDGSSNSAEEIVWSYWRVNFWLCGNTQAWTARERTASFMRRTSTIGTAFDFAPAGSALEGLLFTRVTVKRMRRSSCKVHLPAALCADWFVVYTKMPGGMLLHGYHFLALFLRPD
jgi:hypothetical protein